MYWIQWPFLKFFKIHELNSADRHSLQFTINKIVYKIFGVMSKDFYIEISAHFGVESVENLVANRRSRFINSYGDRDNYLCQILRWLVRLSECIFIDCVWLISICYFFSFLLCYNTRRRNEVAYKIHKIRILDLRFNPSSGKGQISGGHSPDTQLLTHGLQDTAKTLHQRSCWTCSTGASQSGNDEYRVWRIWPGMPHP